MGYAHGQLLKEQVQEMLPAFMKHVESEADQYIQFLPKDVRDMVEKLGLDAVLDITHIFTEYVVSEILFALNITKVDDFIVPFIIENTPLRTSLKKCEV